MEKKTAEDIEIDDNQLVYKASLLGPRWNWNILSPIEKGKFIIASNNNDTIVTYEIFMYRTIIMGTLMSIGVGISTKLIWVGLYFFVVLVGLNWITAVTQHKSMLNEIIKEIEKGASR